MKTATLVILVLMTLIIGCTEQQEPLIEPQLENGVTRDIQVSGDEITVTLHIELNEDQSYYLFDEIVPEGLEVLDKETDSANHLKEIIIEDAVSSKYTYKIKGAPGQYTFKGEYALDGMAEPAEIMGDTSLTI